MPDESRDGTLTTGSPSMTSRLLDLLMQALPAIGGAIGFVGFVAVIGGTIEWVRFWSAELPADQAVEVIPRTQLVTIGSVSTIAFTLAGLLAVLTAYLIDRRGNASTPTWRGVVVLSVAGLLATLAFAGLDALAAAAVAAWILVIGGLSFRTVDHRALKWVRQRAQPPRLREAIERLDAAHSRYERAADAAAGPRPPGGYEALVAEERDAAGSLWVEIREVEHRATEVWTDRGLTSKPGREPPYQSPAGTPSGRITTAALLARSTQAQTQAWTLLGRGVDRDRLGREVRSLMKRVRKQPGRQPFGAAVIGVAVIAAWMTGALDHRKWLIPVILLLLVPPAYFRRITLFTVTLLVAGTTVLVAFDETAWLAIMVFVTAVLAATILGIARVSSRFAWYGITVFLSVPLFGATLSALRTVRSPKLQPAAVVRKSDDVGLCGVYIAQTADRIYLGHIEVKPGNDHAKKGSGRVFWVRLDDVDLVTVGPLMSIKTVNDRAKKLLDEVYIDRAAEAPLAGAQAVADARPRQRPHPPIIERDPDRCNTVGVS